MTRATQAAVLGVASLLTVSVWAADARQGASRDPAADTWLSRSHVYPAVDKLGRGVGNTLTGWLEIPLTIQKRYAPQDPVSTFVGGTLVGLVKGTARTLVGVYEMATFFIPYPEHFAPILPPLEYFSQAPPRWR